jgi:hypothetical protein
MSGDVFEDGDRNLLGVEDTQQKEHEKAQLLIKWKKKMQEFEQESTPILLQQMPIRIKRTVWTDEQIKGFVEKLVIVCDVILVVCVLTCLVHSVKKMWPTKAHLKYASKYVYEHYPFLLLVCLNFAYQYGAAVFSFCNFVCKAIFRFKEADKLVKSTTPEPPTPEPPT